MDNFFADYPVENGGGSGVTSLNGLTGALTLVSGSGITITPSGSTITIAASGGPFANTSLSNLTPTAINQNLVPNANSAFNLGSTSLTWNNLYVRQVQNPLSGDTLNINTTDDNISSPTGSVLIKSGDNVGGDPANSDTGNVTIQSGSAVSGGNTGSIILATGIQGPPTGPPDFITPVRGKIQFQDGTESGGVGYVWTLQDTSGTGHWEPASGSSGANTALSNLTVTAINQNLLPEADLVHNLGDVGLRWQFMYLSEMLDNSNGIQIDLINRDLVDSTGTNISVDWQNRLLYYDTGTDVAINYQQPSVGVIVNKTLTVNGGHVDSIRVVTGSTTIVSATDYKVVCNASAGSYNLNLPGGDQGRNFIIVQAAANSGTFTIVPNGSDVLDTNIQAIFNANQPVTITYNVADTTWYAV